MVMIRFVTPSLAGGWTNRYEKYATVKLDHETPSFGMKIKKYLKPPSSETKSHHHTFQELFVMRSQLNESQFAGNAPEFPFQSHVAWSISHQEMINQPTKS